MTKRADRYKPSIGVWVVMAFSATIWVLFILTIISLSD